MSSSQIEKEPKRGKRKKIDSELQISFLVRVFLLSRNTGNPTVGSLRDKKENYSTQRGLRVGTGFREFTQTSRGRGFSLLGFYSSFNCIYNVCVE